MLTNLITFDAESRAICRYICDKYAAKENTSLMGSAEGGLTQRAAIDQWLEVESQSFNPPSSTLVAQLIFFPQMKLKQDAAAIRERASGNSKRCMMSTSIAWVSAGFWLETSSPLPISLTAYWSRPALYIQEECRELVGGDLGEGFLEEGAWDAQASTRMLSKEAFVISCVGNTQLPQVRSRYGDVLTQDENTLTYVL